MNFTALTPMLTVADMEQTIRFYTDALGFACISRTDGWAALRRDSVELMVRLPTEHETLAPPNPAVSLYFNPDDVNALWELLKDKVSIVYPIENFFYGMREFAILDNNGYMLQFGQPIAAPSEIPVAE